MNFNIWMTVNNSIGRIWKEVLVVLYEFLRPYSTLISPSQNSELVRPLPLSISWHSLEPVLESLSAQIYYGTKSTQNVHVYNTHIFAIVCHIYTFLKINGYFRTGPETLWQRCCYVNQWTTMVKIQRNHVAYCVTSVANATAITILCVSSKWKQRQFQKCCIYDVKLEEKALPKNEYNEWISQRRIASFRLLFLWRLFYKSDINSVQTSMIRCFMNDTLEITLSGSKQPLRSRDKLLMFGWRNWKKPTDKNIVCDIRCPCWHSNQSRREWKV